MSNRSLDTTSNKSPYKVLGKSFDLLGFVLLAGNLIGALLITAPLQAQSTTPAQSTQQVDLKNSLRLSAYEGNPEAQFKLALAYSQGKANQPLAAYWYTQAARQGMANAQYNLGHFYLQGVGVAQDTEKTIQWWKQAAHQNYPPAQHNIGTAYFEGIGVEKNNQLALQWFERCAKLGSKPCLKSLAVVMANIKDKVNIDTNTDKATVSNTVEPIEQNTDSALEPTIQTTPETDLVSTTPEAAPEKLAIPVHIQASSNSTIISQLTSSEDFTIIAGNINGKNGGKNSGKWQQVQLKKPVAIWCYKSFVSIKEQTATLTGHNVRARTKPSTKTGKIVKELAKGTELRVLQEKEKWVQLALTDHIAWIPAANTKPTSAPSPTIVTTNQDNSEASAPVVAVPPKVTPPSTTKPIATIKAPKKLIFQYSFLDRRSDDDWLFKSNPEQFTLLLGSFDNSKQLTQFASEMNLAKGNNTHVMLAKRGKIEWKYALYGNFNNQQAALQAIKSKGFTDAYIERIGNIQEQRCSAWKTTIPSPKKLPIYCLKKTAFNS